MLSAAQSASSKICFGALLRESALMLFSHAASIEVAERTGSALSLCCVQSGPEIEGRRRTSFPSPPNLSYRPRPEPKRNAPTFPSSPLQIETPTRKEERIYYSCVFYYFLFYYSRI